MQYNLKEPNLGITAQSWLVFFVRLFAGIFFIYAGWNRLTELSRSKDILDFFRIGVPDSHRWDPFSPFVELLCGTLLVLGLMTRGAVLPLLGILIALFFNSNFSELTGVHLNLLQGFGMTAALILLYRTGPGTLSLDERFFRRARN